MLILCLKMDLRTPGKIIFNCQAKFFWHHADIICIKFYTVFHKALVRETSHYYIYFRPNFRYFRIFQLTWQTCLLVLMTSERAYYKLAQRIGEQAGIQNVTIETESTTCLITLDSGFQSFFKNFVNNLNKQLKV